MKIKKFVRLKVSKNDLGSFDLRAELTEKGKEKYFGAPFDFPYFKDGVVTCANDFQIVSELRLKGKFKNGIWEGSVKSPAVYKDSHETIKSMKKVVKTKILKEMERCFSFA